MTNGPTTTGSEIRPLTSLRGVAALYVVIYHFHYFFGPSIDIERWTPFFSHGARAVDLFFILSGFILAQTTPPFDSAKAYARFLWRRLARIYPLHLCMLGAFVSVETIKLTLGGQAFTGAHSVAALLGNLFLVQSWGIFSDLTWNIPAWSISAEFAAYLAFPLLILLRQGSRLQLLVSLLLLVLVLAGVTNADLPPLHAVPHALVLVALGVALHPFVMRWRGNGRIADAVLVGALLLMGASLQWDWGSGFFVVFAAITVAAGARADGLGARLLGTKPLHWLGLVSYSIYLVHYFALDLWTSFVAWRLPLADHPWLGLLCLATMLAATLRTAQLTYRLIELPARRGLTRLGDRISFSRKISARAIAAE